MSYRACAKFVTAALCGGILLLIIGWQPVSAQQAVSFSGSPAQGPSVLFPQAVAVSDVFLGRNTVGPYLLTWKNIEAGTELVSRGATRLTRDRDYRLDEKTGSLTFTSPLHTREIARIDYHYDPKVATANNASYIPPFQFSLFDVAHGALTFNALVKPDQLAAGQTGARNSMLLAMGSSARLNGSSTLASKLFVDLMGGNVLQRSGLQLKEQTGARYGTLSASFTRAGADFKGPDDAGIAAGKQILDLSAASKPIRGITAATSFQQATDLPAQGKGATTAVLTEKLGGTLGARTRFAASRVETNVLAADSTSVSRIANRLQVDQKLDTHTQATALFEQNSSQSGSSQTVTQAATVNVRSQPLQSITLLGTFGNRLSASGPEDSDTLKLTAEATKQLKLSAAFGDRYNNTSASHTREASIDYAPLKELTLSGSLQMRSDAKDSAIASGVSATVKPASFLEVTGAAKLREAVTQGVPDPNAPDTYDVKLAFLLPNKIGKLSGGYSLNPEDDHGTVTRARNSNISLQSTLGIFDLGGGYTLREDLLSPKVNSVLDLSFGWRMAKTTQIATTYRQEQALDQSLLSTDTYGLRLTHRIGSLLDLSLSGLMTTYLRDGMEQQKPDYRAEAKLGIKF